MAPTKLVLHHLYRDDIAYDWSHNANHGELRNVQNGPPSGLEFDTPSDEVFVEHSTSLRAFGEIRIRVVFHPKTIPTPGRYNLVEGHLAFALYLNEDGSLQATINSPSAGWLGPQSAPGAVSMDRWHTADFTHDGISRARLHLDGAVIAERYDVPGPIPDIGWLGLHIGHWPDGDDYTLVGNLEEVQIWKQDPKRDASAVVDDCCMDLDWIDQQVDTVRRSGWTGAAARDSLNAFFDHARAAAAEVRGGSAAQTMQINALTQQVVGALSTGNTNGVETPLAQLLGLATNQLGQARLEQLGHQLLDDLRSGPLGPLVGSSDEETIAFFEELVDRVCLGDRVPERPPDREPHRGDHPPERIPDRDPTEDTVTDLPDIPDPPLADETDPSWQPDDDGGPP